MVVSIIINQIRIRILPERKIIPAEPDTLVFILPCYNETLDELTKSLDSLAYQTGIDAHRRALMVVCDGRARGPDCQKTSADYLLDDILEDKKFRKFIKNAYIGWTRESLDVEIQSGTYKGLPYFCIVKQENQGKRDSLIALRSFLYNYNIRARRPKVIFSPTFFGEMASFLANDAAIDNVSCLVGMDGDTVFADNCVTELLKESRYPNTVGVCGYVAVDFTNHQWSLWNIYQSAEYTVAQGLRRLHQSIVTHKVSCLPGCIQLLKVCETTCGDHILFYLFGFCPKPTDNLIRQIRATANEDRNHVCLMLSTSPTAQTRQALRALTAPGIQWFERILATANCLVWFINVFVVASLACLIAAIMYVDGWVILCFASIIIVPVLYYIGIIVWLPRGFREKLQYAVGCLCYIVGGPFINVAVLFYSVYFVDSFGWGKTRKVATEQPTDAQVAVPIDEERDIGVRTLVKPEQHAYDTVAILGANVYATHLLKAFGVYHKIIYFDTSVDALESEGHSAKPENQRNAVEITSDEKDLARAKVYLIAAPFSQVMYEGRQGPLDLMQAVDIVSRHLKPGDIVIIETTVSIGVTRTILEGMTHCGALVAYSPPPSDNLQVHALTENTKVISAINNSDSYQIERIYRRVFPQEFNIDSLEVAEMYHLLENTFYNSQASVKSGYGRPFKSDQLLSDFKKLSLMWQKFMVEADNGLSKMSCTLEHGSSIDPSVVNEGKLAVKETVSEMPVLALPSVV
ncbi:Chitin synthase [Aspergillus sclerotialis]|uniref:Chitin synthase n=1 Tax=Aspergillus sclerotialis TaxID=2070753 RepID=A0A3A3A439_9EURO|nr:Chitin synthase [Aspergillus sclerotialis]